MIVSPKPNLKYPPRQGGEGLEFLISSIFPTAVDVPKGNAGSQETCLHFLNWLI